MNNESGGKNLAIGLLVGVAVGVAIGYLTSPKAGKETRGMILEKAEEIRDKAGSALSRIRDAACAGVGATKES